MNAWQALFADELFWCGFIGASGAELVTIYNAVRRGHPPSRLRSLWFWLLWFAVSLIGGWLAARVVTLEPAVVATMTGASVTIILQKFSKDTPGR